MAFNYVYKPVLDDAPWRSFDSMAEYRQWCEENLPKYLGYGRLDEWDQESLDHLTTQMAKREIDRRNQ